MTKPTLANLYRQATRDAAALPDADTLLALARGVRPVDAERVIGEVAQSALQSDLLHFTRALEPAASALAADLSTAFGADEFSRTVHRRTLPKPVRAAAGRWRDLRRVGIGMAAAIIAGVAIWTQQHTSGPAVAGTASAAPDRIFAALNDRDLAGQSQPDEIFDGSFRGDVIFRSSGG